MRDWHKPRINALVEAGVDMLALETIPSVVEAEMLINLIRDECPDIKAWLTFTVRVMFPLFFFIFPENDLNKYWFCSKMENQLVLVRISNK